MYSVYQPWDPLRVCVVGRSYPPEFYSWITVPHVRSLFEQIAIVGNEFGSTTGRKRQCNWLNLDSMIKAINHNGATRLIINKCDILEKIGKYMLYYKDRLVEFKDIDSMKKMIVSVIETECEYLTNKYSHTQTIFFSSSPEIVENL